MTVVGCGPAGAAAALALCKAGARPLVYEKSSFPRHKVCGEFFSPEILPALERIGMDGRFLARRPARVTHAELCFERRSRRFSLPEAGYGLSRYAFDEMLYRGAVEQGAEVRRETARNLPGRCVWAAGRSVIEPRGQRLFGFKAHFRGPANDAVELYFFPGGYCGSCPVEGGVTNVCGLAGEETLAASGFRVDAMLDKAPRLKARLRGLERGTRWYLTGPLRFGPQRHPDGELLAAGDAGRFVDPFTGSGLLAAVETGARAAGALLEPGRAAEHDRRRRGFYRRQLATTTIIRRTMDLGWAESLAGLVPGWVLFRLTRPAAEGGVA